MRRAGRKIWEYSADRDFPVRPRVITTNAHRSNLPLFPGLALLALLPTVPALRATNGMNMEGYGPVAPALSGASFTCGFELNPANGAGAGVSQSQTTLQLMYSRRF